MALFGRKRRGLLIYYSDYNLFTFISTKIQFIRIACLKNNKNNRNIVMWRLTNTYSVFFKLNSTIYSIPNMFYVLKLIEYHIMTIIDKLFL